MAASINEEFNSQNKFSQALISRTGLALGLTTTIAVVTSLTLSIAVVRHMAQREEAEKALRESEEQYRTLFEGVPVGLYRSAASGQIIDANPAMVRMLGYPDRDSLLSADVDDHYVNTQDHQHWQTLMETEGLVHSFEVQLRRHDGTVIWTRDSAQAVRDSEGRVLYYEGSLEDITERKQAEQELREHRDHPEDMVKERTAELSVTNEQLQREITKRKRMEEVLKEYAERLEVMVDERTQELRAAQEQLIRREKLAVLGQMAGSVGHELRTPLGAISNAAYYLKMVLTDADETIREYLDIISAEVRNSDKIISDLLDFSRTRMPDREQVEFSELVAQVLSKRPPPEAVAVNNEIDPNLPPVYVDPRQIMQVLTNLVVNGYQAMPEGGELTISTQIRGDEVALSITDTGHGISEENLHKLFEPLFTTKAKGIGLGLAVSKNLLESNGGSIEVESIEGIGTTFTVLLPTMTTSP